MASARVVVALGALFSTFAQVEYDFPNYRPRPMSLRSSSNHRQQPAHLLQDMDIPSLRTAAEKSAKLLKVYDMAEVHDVDVDVNTHGQWTRTTEEERNNSDYLWSYTFKSRDALSMAFTFLDYRMCEGCALFIVSEDEVMGAFTQNWETGVFATRHLAGKDITLEVFVPLHQYKNGGLVLHVDHVATAWRSAHGMLPEESRRQAECNINAECIHPENTCRPGCPIDSTTCSVDCTYFNQNPSEGQWMDSSWESQVRSVATIMTALGRRVASGTLINANADGRPVYYSAHHNFNSMNPETALLLFNFRAPKCNSTDHNEGPTSDSVGGLSMRLSGERIDYAFLTVSQTIPDRYNAYMAGWSAVNSPAQVSVGIHHPMGSNLKVSHCSVPVEADSWFAGPPLDHWKTPTWSEGTTEVGSSGSALFDRATKRVIGSLHGGTSYCDVRGWDSYGALWAAYEDGADAFLGPERIVEGRDAVSFYRSLA